MVSQDLIEHLRGHFRLDWTGIHGTPHWARVRHNGLLLADTTGADRRVVELFAFLHDSCRWNDDHDPEHGPRAADFAATLRGRFFELDDVAFALLQAACHGHSDGHLEGDVTVLTCWDADRLDLGRVGKRPDPARLCTPAARDRDLLRAAFERSLA